MKDLKLTHPLTKQSNHITESLRADMSASMQNIMYMVMWQFRENDPADKLYTIHVSDLERATNSRINSTHLIESAEKLRGRGYKLRVGGEIISVAPLSYFMYSQGKIEFKISASSREYFFDLDDNYTLFEIQMALNLKSKYSKWIYEMLCQFKSTGTFKISVQKLKERLGIIQAGKDTYPHFADFDREIIKIAQDQINGNTNITFKYTTKKTGRKITNLIFYEIHSQESSKELFASTPEFLEKVSLEQSLVSECKTSKALAKKVVTNLAAEKIEWVIKAILKKYKAGEIDSIGGYSTTIFKAWLNGAEPTFEKTTTKVRHIPLKPVSQTNQVMLVEAKLQEKLSKDLELEKRPVYGLILRYGEDLKSLAKLETAVIKVEQAIERREVDKNQEAILEFLNRELINQEISQEGSSIAQ